MCVVWQLCGTHSSEQNREEHIIGKFAAENIVSRESVKTE